MALLRHGLLARPRPVLLPDKPRPRDRPERLSLFSQEEDLRNGQRTEAWRFLFLCLLHGFDHGWHTRGAQARASLSHDEENLRHTLCPAFKKRLSDPTRAPKSAESKRRETTSMFFVQASRKFWPILQPTKACRSAESESPLERRDTANMFCAQSSRRFWPTLQPTRARRSAELQPV